MTDEIFESVRPLLFSIAYRMLGSAMDAEDIVQEAWLRYRTADPVAIESPKAYLSTIVTRLSINQLNSARVQRESYIGPWLPEPLLTEGAALPVWGLQSPAQHLAQHDAISMAFLVLLERLTPAERAVFLLREVFEYDYAEIAAILEKSEAACRQLFSRARRYVSEHRPRFEGSAEAHERLVESFLRAVEAGDVDGLTELLAEDVVLWTDGGGKVFAALNPIEGRQNAIRFIIGSQRFASGPYRAEIAMVNGRSAVLLRLEDGGVFLVINLETDEKRIRAFHIVGNPDKLGGVRE
jgi:RNA polymerase sigma-70 factor (ECF subfamily)